MQDNTQRAWVVGALNFIYKSSRVPRRSTMGNGDDQYGYGSANGWGSYSFVVIIDGVCGRPDRYGLKVSRDEGESESNGGKQVTVLEKVRFVFLGFVLEMQ
jgi:hypothetical protein